MDRNIYLVCYDISDRNAQRKVHKLVTAHAIGGQKSFYECLMSQSELHILVSKIQKTMSTTTHCTLGPLTHPNCLSYLRFVHGRTNPKHQAS